MATLTSRSSTELGLLRMPLLQSLLGTARLLDCQVTAVNDRTSALWLFTQSTSAAPKYSFILPASSLKVDPLAVIRKNSSKLMRTADVKWID